MKKIVYCDICHTKMVGNKLRKHGGKYYCESHYTQIIEKMTEKSKYNKYIKYKKILYGE